MRISYRKEIKCVIIVGGTGYIGKHLVSQLKDSCVVVVPYRNEKPAGLLGDANIIYIKCDYSTKSICGIVDTYRPDVLINLAWNKVGHNKNETISDYFDSLRLADKLLRICGEKQVRVVQASSRCVYGNENRLPFSEEQIPHPINCYGISKVAMEQMGEYYSKKYKNEVISLRVSQVVGEDICDDSMYSVFVKKINAGENIHIYGDLKSKRDYIDIDDLCNGIELAVFSHEVGIYNIASGQSLSSIELAQKLKQRCPDSKSEIIVDDNNDIKSGVNVEIDIRKASSKLGYRCEK